MTDLTPGLLMAAAAVVLTHGPAQSRDRIAAALVATADGLAPPDPDPTPTPTPAEPTAGVFRSREDH